jgi:SAM-dependent methyltransferase
MVNVSHQEATPTGKDGKALEIFRKQWELYQKFLKFDYLSNAGAYRELNRFLTAEIARPFDFLDLACGDASGVVGALQGTGVTHYTGVDLSGPALTFARKSLETLKCEVELDEADFTTAIAERTRPIDIVWISLSLHHLATDDKLRLMREIRERLSADGAFLIYEPTCDDGESRPAYLDRFEKTARHDWTALSGEEFKDAMGHVRGCDLPETASAWAGLGREAGFMRIAELYRSPDELFRLFIYRT